MKRKYQEKTTTLTQPYLLFLGRDNKGGFMLAFDMPKIF